MLTVFIGPLEKAEMLGHKPRRRGPGLSKNRAAVKPSLTGLVVSWPECPFSSLEERKMICDEVKIVLINAHLGQAAGGCNLKQAGNDCQPLCRCGRVVRAKFGKSSRGVYLDMEAILRAL